MRLGLFITEQRAFNEDTKERTSNILARLDRGVRRSSNAPVHSSKGRLVVTRMEPRSQRPGIEKPWPDRTPEVRGSTRVQGPLQVGKRRGGSGGPRFPPVTQRPSPHGTGQAACPVDPLTQP